MADGQLQQRLEADARLVEEIWPQEPTQADVDRVAASLKRLMEDHQFTGAQVGRGIGYSSGVVNTFIKGRYKGDSFAVACQAVNLINNVRRKDRRAKPTAFVRTAVAKKIQALILQTEAFSEEEGKLAVIIGDSGHGKSHCLREYAQSDRNALYLLLDSTMSRGAIFAAIAGALKLDPSGSLTAVSGRVAESLCHRHMILILDEASSLSVKQLNALRQVIAIRGQCPLVLAGNRALLKTIHQAREKCGDEDLDQFRSRLMGTLDLDELAADDDGGLYTVDEMRALFEYGGLKLTGDAKNILRRFCLTPGTGRLRTCRHIIAALHTARSIEEAGFIDAATIRAAIEELSLPVRMWLPLVAQSDSSEPDDAATAARAG